MEIRIYKVGEIKKIDIRGTSFDEVLSFSKFVDVLFVAKKANEVNLFVSGEKRLSGIPVEAIKDFSGNTISTLANDCANISNAILAANREVDSYILGDDLSQKSETTEFVHNDSINNGAAVVLKTQNFKAGVEGNYVEADSTGSNGYIDFYVEVGGNETSHKAFRIYGGSLTQSDARIDFLDTTIENLSVTSLTEVPSSLGAPGQVLAVNSAGTALEFVAQSGGGGGTSVTLSGSYDYLTLSGQQITLNQIDYSTDISNLPTTISGYGITDALQLGTTSTTALAGNTTTISSSQASAITANTAKTSFPGFGTTAGTALEGDTALFDGAYSSLTGVPSTFTPSSHTHTHNDITDFDAAVNGLIQNTDLQALNDVNISSIASGEILKWDGSEWINNTLSQAGIASSSDVFSGVFSDLTSRPTTISGYGITDALQLGTTSTTALAGNTTTITPGQASAITANTAKVGITTQQAADISANNAKISYTDASAVAANTAKVTFPGFGTTAGTALEGDTTLLELGTTSSTALAGDTTTITSGQASAITANTAKTSFPGFGTVSGTALEGNTTIPTSTSDLTNDSGFITAANELDGVYLEVSTRTSAYGSGSFEGHVVKFGTGTLSAGKIYVLRDNSGTGLWDEADADAEIQTKGLLGMALGTSPTTNGLLVRGIRSFSNSFTVGAPLYISLTAGTMTDDLSSHTTGDYVRAVGYALSTTLIYLDPSPDYIEVA